MIKQKAEQKVDQPVENKAGQVEIIFYTDPLCCWSWAMEPQLRRLRYEFDGQINFRICMGGLLPGWKNYHDEVNSVSRPVQMGPVWMHAQQLSGMPMNNLIWMKDPPSSSYPACIAVKCATLQSAQFGERYLRLLREAVMIEGKNISKENVLIEVAEKLSDETKHEFNINRFKEDLKNDNGLEAFRKDLQEVQYRSMNRFPALIIKSPSDNGIVLKGYRPYSVLLESIKQVAPQIEKTNSEINEEEYKEFWQSLTKKELEEIEH